MKNSRISQEGYLLIDHRASPGMPADFLRNLGINAPSVGEGQLFETRSLHCTHCGVCVIVNMDRTRQRGHCSSCDHYICDICAAKYALNGQRCVVYEELALGILRKSLVGPSWKPYRSTGTDNVENSVLRQER